MGENTRDDAFKYGEESARQRRYELNILIEERTGSTIYTPTSTPDCMDLHLKLSVPGVVFSITSASTCAVHLRRWRLDESVFYNPFRRREGYEGGNAS